MTPAERARQIDQDEFAAECKAVRERAIVYAQQKRDERRRDLLVTVYGEAGKSMPLYPGNGTAEPQREIARLPIRKPILKRRQQRQAQLYTLDGRSLTLAEWAERLGITPSALYNRGKRLGTIEAAISVGGRTIKEKGSPSITHDGLTLTRAEWAERLGINYLALNKRIHKHGLEQALAMGGPQRSGRRANPANDNASVVASGQDSCLKPFEPTRDHADQDRAEADDHAEAVSEHHEIQQPVRHRHECDDQRTQDHENSKHVTGLAQPMTKHLFLTADHYDRSACSANTRLLATTPGVVFNFRPIEGTGAGRHLQESTEITFSQKAITE